MNPRSEHIVQTIYCGNWDLFKSDKRLKRQCVWERQKVQFLIDPLKREIHLEKARLSNEKARNKKKFQLSAEAQEAVRRARREYGKAYYAKNFSKKKPLTSEEILDKELKRKERAKEAYLNRTPEKKAQYALAAKKRRDALSDEQKAVKRAYWKQQRLKRKLNGGLEIKGLQGSICS
jgi:hypothetical protein